MSLKACAEVSVWTNFCENKLVQLMSRNATPSEILEDLGDLENYLSRPVTTPNSNKRKIRSKKQREAKCLKLENQTIQEELNEEMRKSLNAQCNDLEHKFLEGTDLTVVDLIVFPCLTLLWVRFSFFQYSHLFISLEKFLCVFQRKHFPSQDLSVSFPLLGAWYRRLKVSSRILEASKLMNIELLDPSDRPLPVPSAVLTNTYACVKLLKNSGKIDS